jgi:nitrogen regulatory protein P-II 1
VVGAELYREGEYTVDFLPKMKIEVVVSDQLAPKVADLIAAAAKTGTRRSDGPAGRA